MRDGAALDGVLTFSARSGHTVDRARGRRLNDTKANLASIVPFSNSRNDVLLWSSKAEHGQYSCFLKQN